RRGRARRWPHRDHDRGRTLHTHRDDRAELRPRRAERRAPAAREPPPAPDHGHRVHPGDAAGSADRADMTTHASTHWPAILLLAVAAAGGCSRAKPGGVHIGAMTAITGAQKSFGEAHQRGFTLALEEINAAGG